MLDVSLPVAVVVGVVRLEDGEGLSLVGSGVVCALGGLDVVGALRGGAFYRSMSICLSPFSRMFGSYQLVVFGHLPLVLELAGSRVAVAHASVSARPMKERNCILSWKCYKVKTGLKKSMLFGLDPRRLESVLIHPYILGRSHSPRCCPSHAVPWSTYSPPHHCLRLRGCGTSRVGVRSTDEYVSEL